MRIELPPDSVLQRKNIKKIKKNNGPVLALFNRSGVIMQEYGWFLVRWDARNIYILTSFY
jgi:hypothetical protein